MPTVTSKNILIAPLDWGLGHTTRCVPIIRYLQQQGHNPVVAGNDAQLSFIAEAVPGVATEQLRGYDITYSRANAVAQAGLLAQLPRVARAIKAEHRWLQQMAGKLRLHGVISDNRYGLWHPTLPSVILTHQLQVLSGLGGFADAAVRALHYRLLRRFTAVWVPDIQGEDGLAGKLSHPARVPANASYIGLLSRFANAEQGAAQQADGPVLILISGPEPQRSDLSRLLWQQALEHEGDIVFVAGSEQATTPGQIPAHITYHKRIAGDALAMLLQQASMVVCRSGYSTLMDLVALHKRAILIPTPGQTEQLYLGRMLHSKGTFYRADQQGFNLPNALQECTSFPFHSTLPDVNFSAHMRVIDNWIGTLG